MRKKLKAAIPAQLLGAVLALAISAISPAIYPALGQDRAPAATQSLGKELSAEKQKAIRDFVAVDKPIPIKTTDTLEVGEIAPNGIELLPIGGVGARVPEIARLKYFLSDKKAIVLVNPENREIAYVIK